MEAVEAKLRKVREAFAKLTEVGGSEAMALGELSTALEELQVAEEELSESSERLQAAMFAADEERRRYQELFDLAPDAYFVTDLKGVIQECNRMGAEILGAAKADYVLGMPLTVAVIPEDRHAFLRELRRRRSDEVSRGWELRLKRREGGFRPVSATVGPARDPGGVVRGLRWLVTDLTERKQAEAELASLERRLQHAQRMEAVGTLATGVAHHFNNLLMGVIGCCRMASERLGAESPAGPLLDEIRGASEHGISLTRQLLVLGRPPAETGPVLLNEILEGTQGLLAQLLGDDVAVEMDLAASGASIAADPRQIEQLLLNLAGNARDAMPKGGRLTVRTREVTVSATGPPSDLSPGSWVLLEVQDTGCGIGPATQDRIFDPFFTTKTTERGTGLGLTTVYAIVKHLGGHVRLESEVGRGATFKLFFPRLATTPRSSRAPRARQAPESPA